MDARIEGTAVLRRGEFAGTAGEYFGIWIVNILLTIVTFGIYSAWAKVRRNRYFYGNTWLDGHNFDYHAKGKQIFIGRLIAFVVLAAINVSTQMVPLLGIITPFILLAVLPWFIMRGLRFGARVTSYRNVRFDFVGTTWGAFRAFFLGSIVSVMSLGIMAPFASRWVYRYVIGNLRYGDRPFACAPTLGAIYRVWLLSAVLVMLGLAIAGAIGLSFLPLLISMQHNLDPHDPRSTLQLILLVYAIIIPVILIYVVAGLFYRVGLRNVVLNSAILDDTHPLTSDMSRPRYFWIVLSNTIVTICTLGLMRPWAAVRERRYMVEHTGITFNGDIGAVVSSIQASGSAFSAEYIDMEGFDFGF